MGEHLTDQELRLRLSVFNTVVPPVTNSTRGLLLKKLARLEHDANVQMNQSGSSEKDDNSLLNVSTWNNSASEDEDQNSYLLPDTKKFHNKSPEIQTEIKTPRLFDSSINISSREPVIRRPRSDPLTETPNADKAIQRWRKKMMDQSQSNSDVTNTSQFDFQSPVLSIYSQNSRRYIQPTPQRHQGTSYTRNTQYIILLFVGFFVVIFGLYLTSIQSSTFVLPPGVLNTLCAVKNLEGLDCNAEQEKTQLLYNSLISKVQDKFLKNQCENSDIKPIMEAQTVFEYISTHENMPSREIEELVGLFMSIAKTYSDSPIGFDDNAFNINVQPNLPIFCAIKNIFANMFYLVLWLGVVALSIISVYFGIHYVTNKSEKHRQEVDRLIESTIDLLKQQAQYRPNESYLPMIHIRDQLIPLNERKAKSKIWNEVEQCLTESESRVKSDILQIDGEDLKVWRWVQPVSPGSAKKVWQGQAFETNEGSMNSPQPSPTSCLKIRHMFGPDSLIGTECITRVKDAILEKCDGVEVLHLSVDGNSLEGCVYVKCASPAEAGKAYRQLHGFWYDGKLVTVKFLRLERYHQRFPDAVSATIPLSPSNNEKRSLQ